MPKKLPRVRDRADIVPAQTHVAAIGDMDPRTALVLGTAHVAHGVVSAGGQVGAAALEAAGKVLSSTLESFGNCFTAYMGYLRERQITARAIGVERAITDRVVGVERERTAQVLGVERERTAQILGTEREITARVIATEEEITSRVIAIEEGKTARVVASEREATERLRVWASVAITEACERTEQLRISAVVVLETVRDNRSRREARLDVIHAFLREYTLWNGALHKLMEERAGEKSLQERETHQQHIDALLQRARDLERAISEIAVNL